jgi:hypothetical protein
MAGVDIDPLPEAKELLRIHFEMRGIEKTNQNKPKFIENKEEKTETPFAKTRPIWTDQRCR